MLFFAFSLSVYSQTIESELESVKIGKQIWMKKNLDVVHYRDGTPIRHCKTEEEWTDAAGKEEGAWCYYDNYPANGKIYGKLYNWYAVNDSRGLAPTGWHIPSDAEWKELEMCIGMSVEELDKGYGRGDNEGSKLAGNYDLWPDDLLRKSSEFGKSGFNAIPGGFRGDKGWFDFVGSLCILWSSTKYKSLLPLSRSLSFSENLHRGCGSKGNGYSVRCIKD